MGLVWYLSKRTGRFIWTTLWRGDRQECAGLDKTFMYWIINFRLGGDLWRWKCPSFKKKLPLINILNAKSKSIGEPPIKLINKWLTLDVYTFSATKSFWPRSAQFCREIKSKLVSYLMSAFLLSQVAVWIPVKPSKKSARMGQLGWKSSIKFFGVYVW